MYADFHLIPLNAATSCHQWCPSYPSLQSLVHPVQSSAGVVTEQLLASGRGWVLPVFSLPYAHTIRWNLCLQELSFGWGRSSALACYLQL